MQTIQGNVIAVAVKLLLNCGVCFLLTLMVVLGDAALVTGLHVGAHLTLAVAFGVAVAANLVLVLLLLGLMLGVRLANAARDRRLEEAARGPEVRVCWWPDGTSGRDVGSVGCLLFV